MVGEAKIWLSLGALVIVAVQSCADALESINCKGADMKPLREILARQSACAKIKDLDINPVSHSLNSITKMDIIEECMCNLIQRPVAFESLLTPGVKRVFEVTKTIVGSSGEFLDELDKKTDDIKSRLPKLYSLPSAKIGPATAPLRDVCGGIYSSFATYWEIFRAAEKLTKSPGYANMMVSKYEPNLFTVATVYKVCKALM